MSVAPIHERGAVSKPAPLAGEVDVAIVGGGLVGATLAAALRDTCLRVLLVEGFRHDSAAQPSFDERTTALGNGTRSIFESLAVWTAMQSAAAPIRAIHISDAGRFGFARLNAREQGADAFGYVVPNRVIGLALWGALAGAPRMTLRVPARCDALTLEEDAAYLCVSADTQHVERWRAALVVAADGAQSIVRGAAGIATSVEDYGQVALVVSIAADRANDGTAYERFTPSGPLAVLPLHDGGYTVVWTVTPDAAERMMGWPDAEFLAQLQQCFGWRVGKLLRAGRRVTYPLQLTRAGASIGRRAVLVGNAAQALHPVAGQGFNLGVRDAAMLAEQLAAAAAGGTDSGAPDLLQKFAARRDSDRRVVTGFTDNLIKVFGSVRPGVRMARDLGLLLFDLLPPAKNALSHISWGSSGVVPRLARGLPLVRAP